MKVSTMHCDTIMKLYADNNANLRNNKCHIDIEKLKKADSLVQFFAVFFMLDKTLRPFEFASDMIRIFKNQVTDNLNDMKILTSYDDIDYTMINALISIEEGGVIEGKLENLTKLYHIGVRSITLTWNFENEIGYSCEFNRSTEFGLKDFGYDVVDKMNELGMLIDVSHFSDQGTLDVLKRSKKPIIASHSNSRDVFNHKRNLPDHILKEIANKEGLVGLNFWSKALDGSDKAKLSDMVLHLRHMINIMGEDCVGLGSDFDGIVNPMDFKDISEIHMLADAMSESGFSHTAVEKVFYKNTMRVLKDVL